MNELRQSLAAGYACLSAWADLLDRINVFPVADGDTGTNLRISLAPLRDGGQDGHKSVALLARAATGNSGNIALAFFREFCQAENCADLAEKAALGRNMAWQAIARPRPGTMLTVFDRLAAFLSSQTRISEVLELQSIYVPLNLELQKAVQDTSELLPELQSAGVVDSGALAMYVFFDGFFRHFTRQNGKPASILDLFPGKLAINRSFRPVITNDFCVDMVIQTTDQHAVDKGWIADMGESVVVVEDKTMLKIHLHTPAPKQLREQVTFFGDVVHWSVEEIEQRAADHSRPQAKEPVLHIVTDAAGSITREMARRHGITLLDSYIIAGDNARPESLCSPEQIYLRMRQGDRITTGQASTFERHQHYQNICRQFGQSLYLAVGSAFTGNYETAMAWKNENDPDNLLMVMDSGAASGRLALIALLTARQAKKAVGPEDVIDFAKKAIVDCIEFVFIDELKYLAAGGRISRTSGFFGDLISLKPIISPTREGVRKVGVVRSTRGQLAFALERLQERFSRSGAPVIMLQYSDNRHWVAGTARQEVMALLPDAEILLAPLSLTSGVHMGPGAWSMAFHSGAAGKL